METYTATSDVTSQGGHMIPPGAGLTSDALPEAQSTISAESSQAGVHPKCAFAKRPCTEETERQYALVRPASHLRKGRKSQ